MRYVILLLMGMMLMGCGKDKPTGPKTVNFTVENGINFVGDTYAIITLQFSSTSSTEWGRDQLGDTILLPGGSVSFEVTSGNYDFRATDIDGDCYYKENVKVEEGSKVRITTNDYDSGCSNGKLVVDDNIIKK
jgi:hypothetical protein